MCCVSNAYKFAALFKMMVIPGYCQISFLEMGHCYVLSANSSLFSLIRATRPLVTHLNRT